MADLPSILGGMAQGFLDFGKSAVDLFGTGGASIADLIESARTGKVTTKNSDDFRKWLYDTNDVKDAAAKGLGTALNGVQTVSDYIPGIGAVTRNPLFNAGQGALGGLADEFKMYGKDYDLGRAGQRAAVGAGGALASTGLADALKGSGNALLKSGTAQGLARGAVGGAIGAGGYTAIDGGSLGDVANSALQGAGMGAALGGTMGALQDFRPARTYDVALTDEEKAARIANAKNMLANEQDPERIAELNNQIKDLGGTLADADMAVNSAKPSPARYIDSAGEEVPQELADYFKDASPLVRDENGNLIRFYHGTPNGSFESPAGGSYFTPNREYADVYQSPNASSISFGKQATNPATYETYLDLRKPFDISDPEARRIYIDEYVKGGNATGINPYQSNYDDVKNIDWTEVEGLKEFLEGTGYGYDSIIADEGGVPDGNGGVVSRGKSYIPFESSQVFTLKKNLAQPMEAPVVPAAEGGGRLEQTLSASDRAINNASTPLAGSGVTIAGKDRSWDELYDMLSKDAGAFENEDRTPIAASPSQLRSEIEAIDAKYPNDLPDDIWDRRYSLNQQLKAAEKGYNSPYDYYVGESKKNFRQDFESRPDKYKAKIADIESQAQRQAALDQDIANASPRKLAQFNLIQQKNPAPNETLTWIRSPKDILTWDEAIAGAEGDNAFTWPDYTLEDALRDQKKHSMTVYSSYPIKGGTFVTPSRQQASDYAGGGRVYSKVIRPDDVAWINGDEGQYAYTRKK